jgi:glutamine synthetase
VVDKVIPAQDALRKVADELETVVSDELWPLPKYRELLFQY